MLFMCVRTTARGYSSQAGTFRTPDGGLGEGAGILPELDAVLMSAKDLQGEDLHARLDDAIASAGYPEGSDAAASAGHYARAAKKIAERGPNYVGSELKRLEGLLAGQAISPVKKSLFMVRSNILRSFAKHGFGGENGTEKDEL